MGKHITALWARWQYITDYGKELSPGALAVAHMMSGLCNDAGICWASQSRLANGSGMTTRSVRRRIAELVDKGILEDAGFRGQLKAWRFKLSRTPASYKEEKTAKSLSRTPVSGVDTSVRGGGHQRPGYLVGRQRPTEALKKKKEGGNSLAPDPERVAPEFQDRTGPLRPLTPSRLNEERAQEVKEILRRREWAPGEKKGNGVDGA